MVEALFVNALVKLSGATDWCVRWKKNGWKTINGTEVKNKNEFQKLAKLCDEIDVKWVSCILILCNSGRVSWAVK